MTFCLYRAGWDIDHPTAAMFNRTSMSFSKVTLGNPSRGFLNASVRIAT
jgi:hypothetical protein